RVRVILFRLLSSHLDGSAGGSRKSVEQAPPENLRGLIEVGLPWNLGAPELETISDARERVAGHVRTAVASTGFARGCHDAWHRDVLVLGARFLGRMNHFRCGGEENFRRRRVR